MAGRLKVRRINVASRMIIIVERSFTVGEALLVGPRGALVQEE